MCMRGSKFIGSRVYDGLVEFEVWLLFGGKGVIQQV